MNRINNNRKGIVYSLWTNEEKKCFHDALKRGFTLLWYTYDKHKRLDWIPKDKKSCIILDVEAYWILEWDESIGKELVNKWCWVSNNLSELNTNKSRIVKIKSYDAGAMYPYRSYDECNYLYARKIRKDDLQIIFNQ